MVNGGTGVVGRWLNTYRDRKGKVAYCYLRLRPLPLKVGLARKVGGGWAVSVYRIRPAR